MARDKNAGYEFSVDKELDEQIKLYALRMDLTKTEACRAIIRMGLAIRPHEGALLAAQLAAANSVRVWYLNQVHEFFRKLTFDANKLIQGGAAILPHTESLPPVS